MPTMKKYLDGLHTILYLVPLIIIDQFKCTPASVLTVVYLCFTFVFDRQDASKNKKNTLTALDPLLQSKMGQRLGISYLDAKTINLVYCNGTYKLSLSIPMSLHFAKIIISGRTF